MHGAYTLGDPIYFLRMVSCNLKTLLRRWLYTAIIQSCMVIGPIRIANKGHVGASDGFLRNARNVSLNGFKKTHVSRGWRLLFFSWRCPNTNQRPRRDSWMFRVKVGGPQRCWSWSWRQVPRPWLILRISVRPHVGVFFLSPKRKKQGIFAVSWKHS